MMQQKTDPQAPHDMKPERDRGGIMTARGISMLNILVGVWLVISPYFLNAADDVVVLWNNTVTGLLIGLFALLRAILPARASGLSWLNAVLGAWMIVAPFALLYATGGIFWSTLLSGIAVLIMGVGSAQATARGHAM